MTIFVQILRGLVFLVGVAAISAIGYLVTKGGNHLLGVAITVGLAVLLLFLVVVQARIVFTRRRPLRKQRQAGPLKIFSLQEAASYRHDVDVVWALIRPAESAVLLGDAQRAFSVPGTPSGVGEQQCFIGNDGRASIIEVIAEEPPNWAATKIVGATDGPEIRLTYRLNPAKTKGCVLTYGVDFQAPSTFTWTAEQQEKWRAPARQFLNRVEHVLDLQHPLRSQD